MKATHFILKIMFLPVLAALAVMRLFAEFLAEIIFLEEWIRSFT